MTLYKYLPTSRLDVLKGRQIRFTQPADFNDPFEFRPRIRKSVADNELKAYLDANFDQLAIRELARFPDIMCSMSQSELKKVLAQLRSTVSEQFPHHEAITLRGVAADFDRLWNQSVGILCLSEVRDSTLMWSHYSENHQGYVVGFDSENEFFKKKRSEVDEFGFLRQVVYRSDRPHVTLTNTSSEEWFQTKCDQWSYEKEWRILRVLSEAEHRIEQSPFPVCLFEFPEDAIVEVIVGMKALPAFVADVRSVSRLLPKAKLLAASEDSSYGLGFSRID